MTKLVKLHTAEAGAVIYLAPAHVVSLRRVIMPDATYTAITTVFGTVNVTEPADTIALLISAGATIPSCQ